MCGMVTKNEHMSTRLLVLFLAEGAALFDLKEERIPNLWLLTGLLFSLTGQILFFRDSRSNPDFLSALIPLLLLLPFYLLRMIGAGDIKLLMVTGAFMKPGQILRQLLFTFLSASVCAVLHIFFSPSDSDDSHPFERFRCLIRYLYTFRLSGCREPYWRGARGEEKVHLAVYIFAALIPWAAGWY